MPDSAYDPPGKPTPPKDWFCNAFIELADAAGWASTYCKLPAGHPGPHSAHYPTALGAQPCDVMSGDGSIPGATCILPIGHEGAHYG